MPEQSGSGGFHHCGENSVIVRHLLARHGGALGNAGLLEAHVQRAHSPQPKTRQSVFRTAGRASYRPDRFMAVFGATSLLMMNALKSFMAEFKAKRVGDAHA